MRWQILFPLAERFGSRNISCKLKTLKEDSQQTFEKRHLRMKNQLHTLLASAQQNVPYYRDLFQSIHFDPEWVKNDIRYVQELPFMTKEIIREQGTRLLNKNVDPKVLHVRKTGGSTGPTLNVYYDDSSLDWTAAENIHVLGFTGHTVCSREVHLASQLPQRMTLSQKISDSLKNLAHNRVVIKTTSLDDITLENIWKQLRSIKPHLVQGSPSTLYALALHLQKKNLPHARLFDAFESTGETLDANKRYTIESQLGCKVYNRYGTAEFGVIAHSHDKYNKLQVVDYLVYPEALSLGNGLNELVLTGLTNIAMPLIRYKTGDIGDVSLENGYYWISKLQGRIHDLIYINQKPYLTTFIQDTLEQIGGVDEFQICINSESEKTLKIVPSPSCNKDLVVKRSQELLGDEFKIEFTNYNGLILQGWRSKFRYVVRNSI